MGFLEERIRALALDPRVGPINENIIQSSIDQIHAFLEVLELEDRALCTVQILFLLESVQAKLATNEIAELFTHKYIELKVLHDLQIFMSNKVKIINEFRAKIIVPEIKKLKSYIKKIINLAGDRIKLRLAVRGIIDPTQQSLEVMHKLKHSYNCCKLLNEFNITNEMPCIEQFELITELSEYLSDKDMHDFNVSLTDRILNFDLISYPYMCLQNFWVSAYSKNISLIIQDLSQICAKHHCPTIVEKLNKCTPEILNSIKIFCLHSEFIYEIDKISTADEPMLNDLIINFNNSKNLKALIISVLLLSYRICFQEHYRIHVADLYKKFSESDLSLGNLGMMEINLLKFLDWKVNVYPEKYDDLRLLLFYDYPNLPESERSKQLKSNPSTHKYTIY